MTYAVLAVIGVLAVLAAIPIVRLARAATQRNRAFLAAAIASKPVALETPTELTFQVAASGTYALWLDLELSGKQLGFALAVSIEVGGKRVLDGSYPVTFDDEHDAKGLPNPPGISALNSSVVSTPRSIKLATVLRIYRFDAVGTPPLGRVELTLVPSPGVAVDRAIALVTSPDAPSGSGQLPANLRAIG